MNRGPGLMCWCVVTMGFLLRQRNKAAMHELTVGQKVICKHKNGRYYQCDVVQLSKETFYEVNFDDGSFSDNLFPEDIVVGFTSHLIKNVLCILKYCVGSCKETPKFNILQVCLGCFSLQYLCVCVWFFRAETVLSWDRHPRVMWSR